MKRGSVVLHEEVRSAREVCESGTKMYDSKKAVGCPVGMTDVFK